MLINYWQLHDQIDLVRACDNLIELNLMGCVLDLIGKRSNFSQDAKTKVQDELVKTLLKRNADKYAKIVDNIV